MSTTPELDLFIKEIMNVNIQRMGGAATGIVGSTGSDSDTVRNLKKNSAMFAHEYSKPSPDRQVLSKLSQEIAGYLQTLQLTDTLSVDETNMLINELQKLTEGFWTE